jgi:hypothetical protein
MLEAIEQTASTASAWRTVLGFAAAAIVLGIMLSGFKNLPERVSALEAANAGMQQKLTSMEKEIKLMTCLQIAEMQGKAYQECLAH